jgi:hypothetical protein
MPPQGIAENDVAGLGKGAAGVAEQQDRAGPQGSDDQYLAAPDRQQGQQSQRTEPTQGGDADLGQAKARLDPAATAALAPLQHNESPQQARPRRLHGMAGAGGLDPCQPWASSEHHSDGVPVMSWCKSPAWTC